MNPEHGQPGHRCQPRLPDNPFQIIEAMEDDDHLKILLQGMEAELEAEGWDQKPKMLMLIEVPNIVLGTDAVGLAEMPMPEPWYHNPALMGPPFLGMLRQYRPARDHMKLWLNAMPTLKGLVLFAEGWTAPMPPDGHPDRPAWDQARISHGFHTLPSRIEERFGMACTLEGRTLMISRQRGGFPATRESGIDGKAVYGRLPETLMETCRELALIKAEGT
jgi:hypothetical protein